MEICDQQHLREKAIEVLYKASSEYGIKASAEQKDNYGFVWARDTAVTGLAIISNQLKDLYGPLKYALLKLREASSPHGQIPSNLEVNKAGEVATVSFGGPVGRVDTSFWWIIVSILFLDQENDEHFENIVQQQCESIFKLADSWEFNGKGLMYVPMSSNWADEYVTNGYVLYDQILRCWALSLSSQYFSREDWGDKALQVKIKIKQHFLLEAELDTSLYTKAQQQSLKNMVIGNKFIASFSPGDRVEKFDAWSIALLLLLDIPSAPTIKKLEKSILDVFAQAQNKGIPAFWPLIQKDDALFNTLEFNHSYNFKNEPGHFHNGGIWPVVNGFLIAGLASSASEGIASELLTAMHQQIAGCLHANPFPEYFDYFEGKPGGVNNLCFSASGYLLATSALSDYQQFAESMKLDHGKDQKLLKTIKDASENIIQRLALDKQSIIAISIAGESGSGKTTLSHCMAEVLAQKGYNPLVLHQDDYFILPPKKNHEARIRNFLIIGPGEVRLDLLDKHIKDIKDQNTSVLTVPHMNWITDEKEQKEIDLTGINVIIVDGTYTSLLKEIDHRILINTGHEQTHKNRIKRNRETVTPFIENVLKTESEIIKGHYPLANIILDQQINIVRFNQIHQY